MLISSYDGGTCTHVPLGYAGPIPIVMDISLRRVNEVNGGDTVFVRCDIVTSIMMIMM